MPYAVYKLQNEKAVQLLFSISLFPKLIHFTV